MTNNRHTDILIIGAGPAGITAAIWCCRLQLDFILTEAKSNPGGQLHEVQNKIIDYPGAIYENGSAFLKNLENHLQTLEIGHSIQTPVTRIDLESRTAVSENEQIHFEYLIAATGAEPRRLHVPGETAMYERGEVYSASEDHHKLKNKKVVIVGGGDRAFENASILAEAGAKVDLLHRTDRFRAQKAFREKVMAHPGITVLTFTELKEIEGTDRTESVTVINNRTGKSRHLTADAVLIRIGVKPCSNFLADLVDCDEKEYVLTDRTMQSSHSRIYAAGDITTPASFSSLSTAAGQAMIAVKAIANKLRG